MKSTWLPGETTIALGLAPLDVMVMVAPGDGVDIDRRPTQVADLMATLHPAYADKSTFLRGDAGDAGWCQAELLRVRGERAPGYSSERRGR